MAMLSSGHGLAAMCLCLCTCAICNMLVQCAFIRAEACGNDVVLVLVQFTICFIRAWPCVSVLVLVIVIL